MIAVPVQVAMWIKPTNTRDVFLMAEFLAMTCGTAQFTSVCHLTLIIYSPWGERGEEREGREIGRAHV